MAGGEGVGDVLDGAEEDGSAASSGAGFGFDWHPAVRESSTTATTPTRRVAGPTRDPSMSPPTLDTERLPL
jgi:hypothetical protein